MLRTMHPIAQYLLTLSALIGVYLLYVLLAVPFIEGPPVIIGKHQPVMPDNYLPPDLKAGFENLFAEDDWERQPCKTVQTEHGKILYQDYQPDESGVLEVFPFTMVLESKDGGVPTVIRCLQGARVWLDGPIGLARDRSKTQRPGKVERAELLGQVIIYRPPTKAHQNDAIHLLTSQVVIEKQQAYTLESVDFQFGAHRGNGSHLRIELDRRNPDADVLTSSLGDVKGVKRIRLSHLSYLQLHPDSSAANQGASRGIFRSSVHPVVVSCSGPFYFDLVKNTATFEEAVEVVQQVEKGDSLLCEYLEVGFSGPSLSQVDPVDRTQKQSLRLQNILARGSPAVLHLPSEKSRVVGETLEYDDRIGFVGVQSTTGKVTVSTAEFEFESPEVRYQLSKDGSLGDLDAAGPGVCRHFKKENAEPMTAEWSGQLTIRSDGERKLVSVDGNSGVQLNRDEGIRAEHIQFWLWAQRQEIPRADKPKIKWKYLPSKMIARGNVRVQASEFDGTARRLVATWPDLPVTEQVSFFDNLPVRQHIVRRQPLDNMPARRRSPAELPIRQELQADAPQAGQAWQDLVKGDEKRQSRFVFDGDFVAIQFTDHSSRPQVGELRIDGNVTVIESKPDGKPGARIEGSNLHMTPQTGELYRVFVGGNSHRLAKLDAQSMVLTGINIHLDQAVNKLWVDGRGELQWESAPSDQQVNRNAVQTNVKWLGGMIFDGKNLYFEQVSLEAVEQILNEQGESGLRRTKTQSRLMNIVFVERVNLQQLSGPAGRSNRMDVSEVILIDRLPAERSVFQTVSHAADTVAPIPVVIDIQRLNQQQQLVEKQRFLVPNARIRPESGDVKAKGPGLVSTLRIDQRSSSFQTASAAKPLSYLRVNFDSQIDANSAQNQLEITGNVRALFLPTDRWDTSLDPDQISQIPAGGGKLVCQQVNVEKWQGRMSEKPTTELVAQGNAHIWGDRFEATADQVRYNELNDYLIIEGTPRTDAKLWYQTTPTTSRSRLVAGKIWYRISDQTTRIEKIKHASTGVDGR